MIFPAGRWTQLLIGSQWPDDQDIAILSQSRNNRAAAKRAFAEFAELLGQAETNALAEQHGHTVEDLRSAFRRSERHARAVGERNSAKQKAYDSAYDSVLNLQQDLTTLSEEGNREIEEIEQSKAQLEAKTAEITALIVRYQAMACIIAAKYSGNVIDSIQSVLDAEGAGVQARQFVQAQGIDTSRMFRRPSDPHDLSDRVRGNLSASVSPEVLGTGKLPTAMLPTAGEAAKNSEPELESLGKLPASTQPVVASGRATVATSPREVLQAGKAPSAHAYRESVTSPAASLPPAPVSPASAIPATPMSPMGSPMPPVATGRNGLPEPPVTPLPHVSPAPPITPAELAQSFNKGMESGAPLSAAAHTVTSAPMTSTEPQISHTTPTIPSASVTPQVHAPVVDSPPQVHHTPVVDAPQPAPIVAAPQSVSPPATPQAIGTLPTYGSDLRPPVPTTAASPAPASTAPPPPASPSSAPVTPAAGHSAANQPAVVRRTPPSTPPPPPSTLGAQAVAATATGAALGTASAETTARKRLQRLVTAVARQQPRLAWAAGDHADNTTLLVTDLAGGWIPPGIELPSAVTLLPPARRRGTLEALLGSATATASYTPIHHVPDDTEPTATSPRPRTAPAVSDLGWELSQATQWRDGLPRLAHTLAKAASAGSGVLDSEIDLLHQHLTDTSKRVLDSYPDDVDTHDVGNWQLLAAIDALVAGDKAGANYHLAWFLAAKAAN